MYIHIRIKTKQKEECVVKITDSKYEVSVKEEAKQNKANNKMLQILKEYFDSENIQIVSGHHSPSKLLVIKDK